MDREADRVAGTVAGTRARSLAPSNAFSGCAPSTSRPEAPGWAAALAACWASKTTCHVFAGPFGCRADGGAAGEVAPVAVEAGRDVRAHDIAFLQLSRPRVAVRVRGVLAEEDQRDARRSRPARAETPRPAR